MKLNPYTEDQWQQLPAEERQRINVEWGYPNAGTDYRPFGPVGGKLQGSVSFLNPVENKLKTFNNGGFHAAVSGGPPGTFLPYAGIYIPRADGTWWSLRAGYRWDPNWVNPETGEMGGYILDAIYKSRMDHVVL